MGNKIVSTFALYIFLLVTFKAHSQKGTFPLSKPFMAVQVPGNSKIYLVPDSRNEVVVSGIDIEGLEIRVVDNLLLITTEEKVNNGRILIYFDRNNKMYSQNGPIPAVQEVLKL